MQRKQSPAFCLSGYLDNRAEGFPDIRQTWHGSEGIIYFLISEKGFAKIPTEKKTLYMELNVENKKEAVVRKEIQNILEEESTQNSEYLDIFRRLLCSHQYLSFADSCRKFF